MHPDGLTYREVVNRQHEAKILARLEGVGLAEWDVQNIHELAAAWDQKTVDVVCDLMHRVRVAAARHASLTADRPVD